MPLSSFRERRYPVLSHDVLIFVEGVELSKWLSGSVEWSLGGTGGENTASFSLVNAYKAFTITESNLKGLYHVNNSPLSEGAKKRLIERKASKNAELRGLFSSVPTEQADIYPLNPGRPVFHKNDRARIWVKDPYGSGWIPAFAGYLDSAPSDDDYVESRSTINLSFSDIRRVMTRSRVQTNPLVQTEKHRPEPLFNDIAGIFRDLETTGQWSHILAQKNFEDMTSFLLTGGTYASTLGTSNITGFDKLKTGLLFEVDPQDTDKFVVTKREFSLEKDKPASPSSLSEWNDLTLFGANLSVRGGTYSKREALEIGAQTFTGGEYDPGAARVHYLLPKAGTGFKELIEYAKFAMNTDRQWSDRKALIDEVCDRLSYEWCVTGFGDIVFEPPLFDFEPHHFGKSAKPFVFDHHANSVNVEYESGDIATALVAVGGVLYADDKTVNENAQVAYPQAWVTSPVLAARHGVMVDTMTFPHTNDTNVLCHLAVAEFMKRLSRSTTVSMNTLYRPGLLPNRPCLIKPLNKMATVQSVNYSLDVVGFAASCSLSLQMPRDKGPDGLYRFIVTGGQKAPISYRAFNGIGQLFRAQDSAILARCEVPEVAAQTHGGKGTAPAPGSNNASRVAKAPDGVSPSALKNALPGAFGRNDLEQYAANMGVPSEVLIGAIMLGSETLASASDEQMAGVLSTAYNRVGNPRFNGKDHANDLYEAVTGSNRVVKVRQYGQASPYSTANGINKSKHFERALAISQRVYEARQKGEPDPVKGATNFIHPKAQNAGKASGKYKKDAKEIKSSWEKRGYTHVSAGKAEDGGSVWYFTPNQTQPPPPASQNVIPQADAPGQPTVAP